MSRYDIIDSLKYDFSTKLRVYKSRYHSCQGLTPQIVYCTKGVPAGVFRIYATVPPAFTVGPVLCRGGSQHPGAESHHLIYH
jgi:hypothetical protein